jgi:hypothetical protein
MEKQCRSFIGSESLIIRETLSACKVDNGDDDDVDDDDDNVCGL